MKALLPFYLYFIKEDPEKDTEKVAQLVKGKRKQEHQALTLILAIFSLENSSEKLLSYLLGYQHEATIPSITRTHSYIYDMWGFSIGCLEEDRILCSIIPLP